MRSSRGSLPERSGAPLLHARTRRVSAQRSDDSRDPAGLRNGRLVLRVAFCEASEPLASFHLQVRVRWFLFHHNNNFFVIRRREL